MITSEFGRKSELISPRSPVKKASLQERVRHRLQDLVSGHDVSHEVLGRFLGLSRSGVSRMLNDTETGIGLHHIERLCEFFQVSPAELVADPSAVITPVSPLEAALLERFRKMTEIQRMSLINVLDWQREAPTRKAAHRHPPSRQPPQRGVE